MFSYEKTGVLFTKDLKLPSNKQLEKGIAIIECVQKIPCNPCVESCPVDAISMKNINALPLVNFDKCIGCGKCVGSCPGLAIFVIKIKSDKALITLPYEFLPAPKVGDNIKALDREGNIKDDGTVKKIIKTGKTMIITVEVKKDLAMDIRNIKVEE